MRDFETCSRCRIGCYNISLYEQLAEATGNKAIRRVLLDVAREEKTHVGEFQALLLREDEAQRDELQKGRREVEEELNV